MRVFINVDKKNLQALESLKALQFCRHDEIFNLYEVESDEISNFPEFSELHQYTQEELEKKIIENSRSQMNEIKNRLYLDFIPTKLLPVINNKSDIYHYDQAREQWYIAKDQAILTENISTVRQCLRRKEILATDFGSSIVTPGREMLAKALNLTNAAEREEAIAKALNQCVQEAAFGQRGAISSFSDIIHAEKVIGRKIGFFKAFMKARDYYTSVNKSKNIKIIEKVAKIINQDPKTAQALKQAEEKVKAIFDDQAAKNIKLPLAARLAFAMRAKDSNTRLSLASEALSDYIKGHALQASALIAQKERKYFHSEKAFMSIVKDALYGTKVEDQKTIDQIMQMAKFISSKCYKIDHNVKACLNPTILSEQIEILKEKNFELANEVKEYFKKENLFKINESSNNKIHRFSQADDPLYIVASYDERKTLQEKFKDKIFIDPVYGSLCVKDTPENHKIFAEYLPVVENLEFSRSIDELRNKALEALKSKGFNVNASTLNCSGRWTNDKFNKSLAYVINLTDGVPRMEMIDRNGSFKEKVILGALSPEEKQQVKQAYVDQKLARETLVHQQQAEISKQIRSDWSNLKEATSNYSNTYIDKKGLNIIDFGKNTCFLDEKGDFLIKFSSDKEKKEKLENALVFPIINSAGVIKSAQFILQDGSKRFAKGAGLSANFIAVGGFDHLKKSKTILVAEGVATAASIAKCTPEDTAVVACLSANNMMSVTKSLSEAFPEKALGIMADNDIKTAGLNKKNPGLTAAALTVKALQFERPNISYFTPPLTKQELMQGKTDFNDSYQLDPQRTAIRVKDAVNEIEKAHRLNLEAHQSITLVNEMNNVPTVENTEHKSKGR